jgi:hypothetical protein
MSDGSSARRDWIWDVDGKLEGLYVEIRRVTVKNGPSAGQRKLVFDFHVGLDDELVTVWETSVLKSKFKAELQARRADDFQPGEKITIDPLDWKEGVNGKYRDFAVTFKHAAPKPTAATLLDASEAEQEDDGDEWASRFDSEPEFGDDSEEAAA